MSAVLSAETIKLELIKNTAALSKQASTHSFSDEAISNLISALAFADKALTNEIESFLVKCGTPIASTLADGLLAEQANVRSTCAMVLIRLGRPSLRAINNLYETNQDNSRLKNALELIVMELGSALPLARQAQYN